MSRDIERLVLKVALTSVVKLRRTPRFLSWTWDVLQSFGQSKVLRTSYFFLFLVPLLSKAIVKLPDTVVVPFFDRTFTISVQLPFSWYLLFVAAVFASVGNIVYAMMCPKLVKEFKDYSAFGKAQRGGDYLYPTLARVSLLTLDSTISDKVESVRSLYCPDSEVSDESVMEVVTKTGTPPPDVFYFIRDSANFSRPLMRLLASVSYVIAFLCIVIIAVQNIISVIDVLAK